MSERIRDNGLQGRSREASSGGPTSPDLDVLVAQIEATRDDLAETMELIVDRVSPKRVAQRSREQLAERVSTAREAAVEKAAEVRTVVTERTASAREVVLQKTASAREVALEKTASAREVALEKTAGARQVVAEKTAQARQAVADRTGSGDDVVLTGTGSGASIDGLPPAHGVEVPGLAPTRPVEPTAPLVTGRTPGQLPGGSSTYRTAAGDPRPEVLAGAAAALLGLYLVVRRRRR